MKKRVAKSLSCLGISIVLLAGCAKDSGEVPISGGDTASETEDVISVPEMTEEADSNVDPLEVIDTLLKTPGKVYQIYSYDSSLPLLFDTYLPDYLTEEEMEEDSREEFLSEANSDSESVYENVSQAESIASDLSVESDSLEEASIDESETDEGEIIINASMNEIDIVWHIVEDDLEQYQEILDEALIGESQSADDQVDLYLIPGELTEKYCDADAEVAKPLTEIGLTEQDLKEQYPFTREMVSDPSGVQRGSAFEVPCGLFVYRRSIAASVLGTDNPVQVQNQVSDMDQFHSFAALLKEHGYYMLPGYMDGFEMYLAQREKTWVSEMDQLQIDEIMRDWVLDTKEYTEKGYHYGVESLYTEEWQNTFAEDSPVFGFFLTTEEADLYLPAIMDSEEESTGGDWAVCQGPSSFIRGGSFLLAGSKTDNDALTAAIIRTLTCDAEILTDMTMNTGRLSNHMEAMGALGSESLPLSEIFHHQNYLQLYHNAAKEMEVLHPLQNDAGISRIYRNAFLPYYKGEIEQQEALTAFYQEVLDQYPDLLSS